MKSFDAIVVGLGAMGSAALSTLARRGYRVLGLEQFVLGHHRGSSHGRSRIIRTAYYEHPAYVPLAKKAFDLWDRLAELSGEALLRRQSCLSLGSAESSMIRGVLQAAAEHDLPIELLNPVQIAERFPMFRIEPSTVGVLEQQAGVLAVEKGVLAQLKVAESTGFATVLSETVLVNVIHRGGRVVVETTRGEFECRQLVITAGAWVKSLLREANLPLTIMRQVQHWFAKPHGQELQFPIFLYETERGAFYGLAEEPSEFGWKVSQHYGAPELPHPDEVDWSVSDGDIRPVREFLHRQMPEVDPTPLASEVCQYTLTPSRHFLIDRLPDQPNVTVACGFSGHGYKFAPVVSELLADLAFDKSSPWHADIFQYNAHY